MTRVNTSTHAGQFLGDTQYDRAVIDELFEALYRESSFDPGPPHFYNGTALVRIELDFFDFFFLIEFR